MAVDYNAELVNGLKERKQGAEMSEVLRLLTSLVGRLDAIEKQEMRQPEMPLLTMVAAAMEKRFRDELEPIRQAIERDARLDEKVAVTNAQMISVMEQLTAALAEFTTAHKTPKSRTGKVQLPSGDVVMTITEH